MNGREWLLLLALSGLWGSSFFFYKVMNQALPPFTIVLGRMGLAALGLNALLAARNQPLGRAAPWSQLLVLGFFNGVVPFSLFAWAETRISSGTAAMLNATTPLFSVLLAHALRTERLSWGRGAGVLLGLVGVAVLIGPAALLNARSDLLGDAACLIAAFSYAVAGVFARRLRGLSPQQVAAGQLAAGALILLPLASVTDRFWTLPVPAVSVWMALLGISRLGTARAYLLYFRLMATAGPTNAMLVTFLLPISALLLGRIFLGEQVAGRAYAGMAVIGAGLALLDGRILQWRPGRLRIV